MWSEDFSTAWPNLFSNSFATVGEFSVFCKVFFHKSCRQEILRTGGGLQFCRVKKACVGDGGELERALDDPNFIVARNSFRTTNKILYLPFLDKQKR